MANPNQTLNLNVFRMASFCGAMADEHDEPLLPKIHLRRPLHGREAFRPQNQIYERSKENISHFSIITEASKTKYMSAVSKISLIFYRQIF